MSARIEELLQVVESVLAKVPPGAAPVKVRDARLAAVKLVAQKRHIATNTVADKFIRQLRPAIQTADDFDRALEGAIRGHNTVLRDALLAHAVDQADKERITTLFQRAPR
jgi:hypothetical protein